MFEGNRIVAIIPARGGSKGIKDKNIVNIAGKPLISYSVCACKDSKFIDDVIVTTDSYVIAEVAQKYGAEIPFIRPRELATDKSKTVDAVLHAISELAKIGRKYDTLVLIQPTQPLRTAEDIDAAVETFFSKGKRGLVSVCEVDENPILTRTLDNGMLKPLLPINSTCRRQDMPIYYRVNGCIYINSVAEVDEHTSFNDNPVPYFMPRERSVDIDEEKDIVLAAYYFGNV